VADARNFVVACPERRRLKGENYVDMVEDTLVRLSEGMIRIVRRKHKSRLYFHKFKLRKRKESNRPRNVCAAAPEEAEGQRRNKWGEGGDIGVLDIRVEVPRNVMNRTTVE